ncbi:phosphoribosylanthranilate isomerase [Lactiplantibacillus songbeiensis]|uniref:N-(5'-phosphoribosyl)anthranilate isomerase n=1 Tax=Lactiplantibacillus songbeiensis TaxID=2559920 RepID=A0ABW4BXL1_9LACO|nr:phosphoribosylanthranilate isomerase [Lactiplantibacillus songbeiensis]
MTKIKICGLMTTADIAAINHAKPDYAGFVFTAGRHQLTLDQALNLRRHLDSAIPSVGVFVDASLATMLMAVQQGAISIVQLHGHESATTIRALQRTGVPVIQAFRLPERPYQATPADYVMLDSQVGSKQPLTQAQLNLPISQPVFLAGALTPKNVTAVLQTSRPAVIDVSRGVETAGRKDPHKIAQMVAKVHQFN